MDNKEGPFIPVPPEQKTVENISQTQPPAETSNPAPKPAEKKGFLGRLFGGFMPEDTANPTSEVSATVLSPEKEIAPASDKSNQSEKPEDVAEKVDATAQDIKEEVVQSSENEKETPEIDTQDAIIPESKQKESTIENDPHALDAQATNEEPTEEGKDENIEPPASVVTSPPNAEEETKEGGKNDEKTDDTDEKPFEEEKSPEDVSEDSTDGQPKSEGDKTDEQPQGERVAEVEALAKQAMEIKFEEENAEKGYNEAKEYIQKMKQIAESITDESAKTEIIQKIDAVTEKIMFNVLKTNNDTQKDEKIKELYTEMPTKSNVDSIMAYSALKNIGTDKGQGYVDMITDGELKADIQKKIDQGEDTIEIRSQRKDLWDQASKHAEENVFSDENTQEVAAKETIDEELPKAA